MATTGVRDRLAACSIAAFDAWLTSTSMPRRFSSATVSRAQRPQSAMQRRAVAQVGARVAAVGQRVVAVMGEREVARAHRVQRAQPGRVLAQSVAVLDRGHDDDARAGGLPADARHVGRHAGAQAVALARHRGDGLQHGRRAVPSLGPAVHRARALRHVGHEAPDAQAAARHLADVDPALRLGERVRRVGPGDVDMAVEGQEPRVQGRRVDRVGLHPCRPWAASRDGVWSSRAWLSLNGGSRGYAQPPASGYEAVG